MEKWVKKKNKESCWSAFQTRTHLAGFSPVCLPTHTGKHTYICVYDVRIYITFT